MQTNCFHAKKFVFFNFSAAIQCGVCSPDGTISLEIALVEGKRCRAYPDAKGRCIFCDGVMDAKCGEQKRWHWAHHRTTNCDPWWENETPWHRRWKSYFPEDWREVLHEAPSVEKHIADVKTPNGIVFEFQNSPMQTEELRSRENFYGQVIWVVNGEKFRDNYTVLDRLPDPKAEFAEDLVFHQQSLNKPYFCYGRKDRNPDASESYRMGWILSPDELGEEGIQQLIDEAYSGYHWFDWKHRREVWFASKQPVLLDLVVPGNMLAEFCIRLVSAKALIE